MNFINKSQSEMAIAFIKRIKSLGANAGISEIEQDIADYIISVLEKEKPKKAIDYEDKYWGCPICGNNLQLKWAKYPTELNGKGLERCLNCNQKIDWSEVD